MRLLNLKRLLVIICGVLLVSIIVFTSQSSEMQLHPSKLYFPVRLNHNEVGIANISESNKEINIDIIEVQGIEEFRYLDNSSGVLTGRGYSSLLDEYVFIKYENDVWDVLYKSSEEFYYPTLVDNKYLYILRGEEEERSLVKIDLDNFKEEVILTQSFDMESKVIVTDEHHILFVTKVEDAYYTHDSQNSKKYHSALHNVYYYEHGDIRILSEGRYVNWIDVGKTIIYEKDGEIISYNLESEERRIIDSKVVVLSSFEVNSDASMIAFYEWAPISKFMHERDVFLTIMSGEDKTEKYRVEQYKNELKNCLFTVWQMTDM